jgi:hypothetical protein
VVIHGIDAKGAQVFGKTVTIGAKKQTRDLAGTSGNFRDLAGIDDCSERVESRSSIGFLFVVFFCFIGMVVDMTITITITMDMRTDNLFL